MCICSTCCSVSRRCQSGVKVNQELRPTAWSAAAASPWAIAISASGESAAEILVEPDGSLRLATAVRDVGVGAYTMHCQVAAEVLGVEPELVQIDVAGTDGP